MLHSHTEEKCSVSSPLSFGYSPAETRNPTPPADDSIQPSSMSTQKPQEKPEQGLGHLETWRFKTHPFKGSRVEATPKMKVSQ